MTPDIASAVIIWGIVIITPVLGAGIIWAGVHRRRQTRQPDEAVKRPVGPDHHGRSRDGR